MNIVCLIQHLIEMLSVPTRTYKDLEIYAALDSHLYL
jgi:hypothetical protein